MVVKRWSNCVTLSNGGQVVVNSRVARGPLVKVYAKLSVFKMSKRISSFENAGKRYKYYYPEGLQVVGRLRILHWHCFACARPQTRSWMGDHKQIIQRTWRAPELCRICEQAYIALQARHSMETQTDNHCWEN